MLMMIFPLGKILTWIAAAKKTMKQKNNTDDGGQSLQEDEEDEDDDDDYSNNEGEYEVSDRNISKDDKVTSENEHPMTIMLNLAVMTVLPSILPTMIVMVRSMLNQI